MKILLFGGSGQLGHEVVRAGRALNFEVLYPVSSEADISDRSQVFRIIKHVKPDLIINSAAYTAVDKAESEPETAFAINSDGAGHIAEAANAIGARLFHISTDYVFGEGYISPIKENAEPAPLNVYGESKLAGEKKVLSNTDGKALVLRISSLHGKKGQNFVHTMLKLFAEKKELEVVNDITMSTTYAAWLAEVILDLGRTDCSGIMHACCSGAISWYDFASEILAVTKDQIRNAKDLVIKPVSALQYPRAAKRASYSVLDTSLLTKTIGRQPISWQEGLKQHLQELDFKV